MKKYINLFAVVAIVASLLTVVVAQAATQDFTVGGTSGFPANQGDAHYVLERTLDFSSSSTTGTAADVYQLIDIPAGSFVHTVGYKIQTGEDSTCTIDIGDGSDTDGWIDGANVLTGQTAVASAEWTVVTLTNIVGATTNTWLVPTTGGGVNGDYAGGKVYATADTIDMVLNNAADTLKITVKAVVSDLTRTPAP